jgi:hypothetical protein
MSNNSKLVKFTNNYIAMLDDIEYKISFLKELSNKAYIEIALLLPTLNTNLKQMIKKIEETTQILEKSGLGASELKKVNVILENLRQIPQINLDIMTSLQVQDTFRQCIEHIIASIEITHELINTTDTSTLNIEAFKIINYLKTMPELIVAQLENIYTKMNNSIYDLSKKFQQVSKILRPPLELEALLREETEKNTIEMLKEEFIAIKNKSANKTKQMQEKVSLAVEKIEKLEHEVHENTDMLDVSSASTKILEQPLAEILLLNNSFLKNSNIAEKLLDELYKDDPEKIDCTDILEKTVKLFSTKSEIDIAKKVLKGIEIEKSGDEGDLTLF